MLATLHFQVSCVTGPTSVCCLLAGQLTSNDCMTEAQLLCGWVACWVLNELSISLVLHVTTTCGGSACPSAP